nr:hypothetical protein [Candidatus Baldrarchaeota archaeon]
MANASAKMTTIKLFVKALGLSVTAPDIAAPEYAIPKPAPKELNPTAHEAPNTAKVTTVISDCLTFQ